MHFDLLSIVQNFSITGQIRNVVPYGSGHIHDTFRVTTDTTEYLLQHVNQHVFKDVKDLTANIIKTSDYLNKKMVASKEVMQTLHPVPSVTLEYFYIDKSGSFWRMFNFIENSRSINRVENPEIAFEGGKAYGWFLKMLSDFPAQSLKETIPRFHDIYSRLDNFRNSVRLDVRRRVNFVQDEQKFIETRAGEMVLVHQLGKEGKIPLRVTHNDTKINNVLFNEENKGICVIDLDTVMPGYVHFDFGDAIRTFTNTANEDEKDLQTVSFDTEIYKAFAHGFLSETKSILNQTEIETLAFSAKLMTFIIGLRFLTDYLDGDVYYKTNYPEHNLTRARVQFKLLQSMESHFAEMKTMIRNEAGK